MATKKYQSIKIKINKNKTKKCMDVEGGFTGNNGRIILYPCHPGPNQKFHYNRKTKQLRIKSSGKCVDIGSENKLVQNKCSSSKKTQKWIKRKNNWVPYINKKLKIKLSRKEKDPKTLGDLAI